MEFSEFGLGLGSDETVAGGDGGGLAPAGDAELGEDVAGVAGGGGPADEERLGDFRVGQALAQEGEDFPLAAGEV